MLLAVGSQHLHQSQRIQDGDLPVLSWPPIRLVERPYGVVRQHHRCGRLKFESINISQTPKVEMAYWICVNMTQPPTNTSKYPHGLIRHRRQHGRIKIKCINVNQTLKAEKAYLECANTVQPPANSSKRPHRVIGLIRQQW